ncbi:hypothetical protein PHMEG_0009771 [Phytophthora megakarya]|uniref:Uncharacterized protein n=1 Tax=Phytophthora megakarya TaxID=4795 RepID=A0A225WG96_9STRA|nr:hypothetical protein PHMEG_0009771 [Phytophthora megakarya]
MTTLEPKTKGQAWSTVLFGITLHKGDQTGAESLESPYLPHQCAILAHPVHLFHAPNALSKDHVAQILRRVIKSLSKEGMCELSCTPEDIDCHSFSKGSSSYTLGQVNRSTPVSMYLLIGQSLGKLKDR